MRLWQSGDFQNILVGCVNPQEPSAADENQIRTRLYELGHGEPEKVRVLGSARYSKDEADWLAQTSEDLNVRRLVLVEPDYHMPRAYVTTLDSILKRQRDV